MTTNLSSRFSLLKAFTLLFISLSSILRLVFLILSFSEADHGIIGLIKIFIIGLFYDIGTISFFVVTAAFYFLAMPKKIIGSLIDKISCYFGFVIGLLIIYFAFFAEITFWSEFHRRFNFIAVDYLIYTYEVVQNINESYPLPVLIGGILTLVVLTIFFFKKWGIFTKTFSSTDNLKLRLGPTLLIVMVMIGFTLFVKNEHAELSENRYNNELSKAGIYSFFAALMLLS